MAFFTHVPRKGEELWLTPCACRLGLIGDLGQTENSAQTLEHLTATGAASVINVGDLSYADGYAPRWDSYMRLTAPHTQRVAWALIEGNHEQEVCFCMLVLGEPLDACKSMCLEAAGLSSLALTWESCRGGRGSWLPVGEPSVL